MSEFTIFDIHHAIEIIGELDHIIRPQLDSILANRGYELKRMSGIDVDWSTTFECEDGLVVEWEDYCGRGCYCSYGYDSVTLKWEEVLGKGTEFTFESLKARADQIDQQFQEKKKQEGYEERRKDRETRIEKAKHEYETLLGLQQIYDGEEKEEGK